MAKTIEQLKAQGAQVKNATVVGENTATRVGTLFTDIVEHVEQYEAGQTADTEANILAINQEAQARALANEQLNTAIVAEKNRAETAEEALNEKIDAQKNEVNVAKEEALQAIAENEQSAINNFNSQKVTPEMLSESTKQLIEASGGGTVTNLADDEDITSVDDGTGIDVLKFANRTYSPNNFSGKGYKILRKNMLNSKNILTQNMINQPNTIYEIRYDFDLNGQKITLPNNCILKFEGGKIKNGVIAGDFVIQAGNYHIFGDNVEFETRYKYEAYPQWFGAKGDGITDDLIALQKCIEFSYNPYIPAGTYKITNILHVVWNHTHIKMNQGATIFCQHKTKTNKYGNAGATIAFHGWDPNRPASDIIQDDYPDVIDVGIDGGTIWNDNSEYTTNETEIQPDNENAIGFCHAIDWYVKNVTIPKCNRKGITPQYKCINGIIQNCKIYNTGFTGIAIEGQSEFSNNIIVDGCTVILSIESIATSASENDHIAISSRNYKDVTITNCILESYDKDTAYFILNKGTFIFKNNTSISHNARGLALSCIDAAESVVIDSCIIKSAESNRNFIFNRAANCKYVVSNSIINRIQSGDSSNPCYSTLFFGCNIDDIFINYPLSSFILINNTINTINVSNARGVNPISFGNVYKTYTGYSPIFNNDIILDKENNKIVNTPALSPSDDYHRIDNVINGTMCFSTTQKIPLWKTDDGWVDAKGMLLTEYANTTYPTQSKNGQMFFRTDLNAVVFNYNDTWIDAFGRNPKKQIGDLGTRTNMTDISVGQFYWDTTYKVFVIWNGTEWVTPTGTKAGRCQGNSWDRLNTIQDPIAGQNFFDTDINKPLWYDGTNWITADGFVADRDKGYLTNIKSKGLFSEKPTLTDADDGFEYYVTDQKKKILWEGSKWVNLDGTELS